MFQKKIDYMTKNSVTKIKKASMNRKMALIPQ